jgi:hypothetical protein
MVPAGIRPRPRFVAVPFGGPSSTSFARPGRSNKPCRLYGPPVRSCIRVGLRAWPVPDGCRAHGSSCRVTMPGHGRVTLKPPPFGSEPDSPGVGSQDASGSGVGEPVLPRRSICPPAIAIGKPLHRKPGRPHQPAGSAPGMMARDVVRSVGLRRARDVTREQCSWLLRSTGGWQHLFSTPLSGMTSLRSALFLPSPGERLGDSRCALLGAPMRLFGNTVRPESPPWRGLVPDPDPGTQGG